MSMRWRIFRVVMVVFLLTAVSGAGSAMTVEAPKSPGVAETDSPVKKAPKSLPFEQLDRGLNSIIAAVDRTAHAEKLGYRVIDRNWSSPQGELDLVVERNGLIVFAEVKARRSDRYGPAAAAVGPDKQRRIRRLAAEWLDLHRPPRVGVRFDVVAITGVRLELIESAF